PIRVLMSYNLCYESGMCDPPEEAEDKLAFAILAEEQAPTLIEDIDTSAAEIIDGEPEDSQEMLYDGELSPEDFNGGIAWQEILKYLLFAFLGGIILNITPCVLPILPIRIMSIINHAQKDKSKVLAHTLIYTLGVLVSFAVMAAVFIGLKVAGQSAGWGTQNQNPYFVIALMAIVYVFALSLLGVFEITAPGMNTASKATSKGGYGGSFFGGIFAFLMAISCTGPFLGAALPFAMRLSSPLILAFFMMIGLGFAFPFILIGLVPKALKIIPKPGDWMVLFKELMGFVLLYLVFTMLKTTLQLTDGAYLLNVVWFMMILGFAIWLYGKFVRMEKTRTTQWFFTIIPLMLIVWAALT
ncbi:MAG: cytochrome c biogenesis protein CcdA, partial [Candidatus Cloacimonadaceae bacterium]|nr:cytochrome c biogenesis protein CcdA [Candidatus Cloacimonadaceae bacterium]